MNLHAKFCVSSSYGLWYLGDTKMDGRTWLYRFGCWCRSRIYLLNEFCIIDPFVILKYRVWNILVCSVHVCISGKLTYRTEPNSERQVRVSQNYRAWAGKRYEERKCRKTIALDIEFDTKTGRKKKSMLLFFLCVLNVSTIFVRFYCVRSCRLKFSLALCAFKREAERRKPTTFVTFHSFVPFFVFASYWSRRYVLYGVWHASFNALQASW